MKKIVFIALVLLVMVGCAEEAVLEDKPSYVDGQAISVAIEKLKSDILVSRTMPNPGPEDIQLLGLVCQVVQISLIRDPYKKFDAKYQGLGVWIVTMRLSQNFSPEILLDNANEHEMSFQWKVYESTGTAESIGTSKDSLGNVLSRDLC